MNGGPFAPFGGPSRDSTPRRPIKGMTEKRLAVLAKIETHAAADRPIRLGGQDGRAARWLTRNGFVRSPRDGAFEPEPFRPDAFEDVPWSA